MKIVRYLIFSELLWLKAVVNAILQTPPELPIISNISCLKEPIKSELSTMLKKKIYLDSIAELYDKLSSVTAAEDKI